MLLSELEFQPRAIKALEKKHIYTSHDLATRFPRRYKDYRMPRPIETYQPKEYGAVSGVLISAVRKPGKKRDYLSMTLAVGENKTIKVMSFNNLYLLDTYRGYLGQRVVICGQVSFNELYGFSLTNPDHIYLEEEFHGRIEPVYPKTKGISDQNLQKMILEALKTEQEYYPDELLQEYHLPKLVDALGTLHFPKDTRWIGPAKERFIFDDLLYFSTSLKAEDLPERTTVIMKEKGLLNAFVSCLPFALTNDQRNAVSAMAQQAGEGKRVNALIEGDVGSGKTAVAAAMMFLAAGSGYQSVLIAPREVLARQHFEEISGYGGKLGIQSVFLSSGMKAKEKKEAYKKIASGEALFIIGTHACLADAVEYQKLGLVIADEEHLFGTDQKEKLVKKAQEGAHSISMSATPIPRTLAMALFGNGKEVLALKEKPAGRLPVKTGIQPDRIRYLPFMENEIRNGKRCYVVCPAISDNEETDIASLESVEKIYRDYFDPRGIQINTINGKMKKNEVETAVTEFVDGTAPVLLSTTVIEVGVNVPAATVMVIEQAERFGLASLHQLRGRVGRGKDQSWCILRTDDLENERLKVLCSTNDGFEIAEKDIGLRGAGNFIGEEQAGSNRYVEEMLSYPDIFRKACAARDRYRHRYNWLMQIYREHETCEESTARK